MSHPFQPPLMVHINYFEQGQTLEEACQRVAEMGAEGIEFRRISREGQAPEVYLNRIARCVEVSGLRRVSFGLPGPELMGRDPAKRAAEVAGYERFLEMAAERLPLGVINTTSGYLLHEDPKVDKADVTLQGSGIAEERHWEQAVEGFRQIGETAGRLGLRLAFETHPGYLHDLPESTLRLLREIGSPHIGANLDLGNFVYFPSVPTPEAATLLLRDHLFLVHLKNMRAFGERYRVVGLWEGEINQRAFLRDLGQGGFSGDLCIESPRDGDREAYLQPDFEYCRRLVDAFFSCS